MILLQSFSSTTRTELQNALDVSAEPKDVGKMRFLGVHVISIIWAADRSSENSLSWLRLFVMIDEVRSVSLVW